MSLQSKPNQEQRVLAVQQVGNFLEDDQFRVVRKSVGPQWLNPPTKKKTHQSSLDEDAVISSNNMDNVTFHNDRFEALINVKGYAPEEIRCNVLADKIEMCAQQQENHQIMGSEALVRSTSINRSYQLPRRVNPVRASCFLSADGILLVTAPWAQPF